MFLFNKFNENPIKFFLCTYLEENFSNNTNYMKFHISFFLFTNVRMIRRGKFVLEINGKSMIVNLLLLAGNGGGWRC